MRIDLIEHGAPVELDLPDRVAASLTALTFVTVDRVPGGGWRLKPGSKVGAVSVGDVEVHVAPKVAIDRVVWMLESTSRAVTWRDDDRVDTVNAPDLLRAVVEVFVRVTTRAARLGLVQGYRTHDEVLPGIRGRVREADQLRRHHGRVLPVEVRYDDYTVDTPENRLLRAAVRVSGTLASLGPDVRAGLASLDSLLRDVPLPERVGDPGSWSLNSLNRRFHTALPLADAIVRGTSFELPKGDLAVTGFVLDMARIFEDFVCAQLGRRLAAHGGRTAVQYRSSLDLAGRIGIRPDLVWLDGDVPLTVVDAKYKIEKAGGADKDIYQMLAYVTVLGVPVGHLVYADDGTVGPLVHDIRGTRQRIEAAGLPLSLPPAAVEAHLDGLAAAIIRSATRTGNAGGNS